MAKIKNPRDSPVAQPAYTYARKKICLLKKKYFDRISALMFLFSSTKSIMTHFDRISALIFLFSSTKKIINYDSFWNNSGEQNIKCIKTYFRFNCYASCIRGAQEKTSDESCGILSIILHGVIQYSVHALHSFFIRTRKFRPRLGVPNISPISS